jgi:hypothetical protein
MLKIEICKLSPLYINIIFYSIYRYMYSKPAHAVTSIKQSPVLKGHLSWLVIENKRSPVLEDLIFFVPNVTS